MVACSADGSVTSVTQTCDTNQGYACRDGGCVQLCQEASDQLSNVGCEYWGVDLDNADVSPSLNAAAQQYAIVVSNVQPDVAATVTVSQDDSAPGDERLGRRRGDLGAHLPAEPSRSSTSVRAKVDGSAAGRDVQHRRTGTALTRHAYKVTSDFPIVAYQFNPLDNVDVFSNDASALLPFSGLNTGNGVAYVVPAWPQTIAETNDPSTNFGLNLRAFLAVVATRPNTHVSVQPTARIVPGGPFASGLLPGASGSVTLQPYDVLNLETGDFDADLTGSLVSADQPVAVFPGSEASDSPEYTTLADRYCCADHLEHQTPPLRSVGKSYVLAKMPNRTSAVIAAGGAIGEVDETEYYRVMAVQAGTTHVTTTLPSPWDAFDLNGQGDSRTIPSKGDFMLTASLPALVLEVQSGQDAGGVPRGLPGGDPSTLVPAPVEQWRSDYVLLAPRTSTSSTTSSSWPRSVAHVYIDAVELHAGQLGGDGLRRPHARRAPLADAALLDVPVPALLPHHRPAERRAPREAERRCPSHPGRPAGGRHCLRLRPVRQLRVRGRDAAHGHQRAVSVGSRRKHERVSDSCVPGGNRRLRGGARRRAPPSPVSSLGLGVALCSTSEAPPHPGALTRDPGRDAQARRGGRSGGLVVTEHERDPMTATAPAPASAKPMSETVASELAESRSEYALGPQTSCGHSPATLDFFDIESRPAIDPVTTPAPATPAPIQVTSVGPCERTAAGAGASGGGAGGGSSADAGEPSLLGPIATVTSLFSPSRTSTSVEPAAVVETALTT